MQVINGEGLSKAFRLVAECGKEINGLRDLLASMIMKALANASADLPCLPVGDPGWEPGMDETQTVYTDWLMTLPLKPKGRGKKVVDRYLAFQVSMMGSGCDLPGNQEPLLHVYCWGTAPSFMTNNYMGFPFDSNYEETVDVVGNRFILWGGVPLSPARNDQGWAYSLRLVGLNTPGDLDLHVIKPTIALLQGTDVAKALPEGLPAVMRYPEAEILFAV